MRKNTMQWLLAALLGCSLSAVADTAAPAGKGGVFRSHRPAQRYREEGTFHLTALQLSGMYVGQNGGTTWTGMFAWVPQYNVTNEFALRANLGVSLFKDTAANHFAVFDYELMLNYTFITEWELEVGGGAQTWVDHGTEPILSANYGYRPKEKLFTFIDYVFVGYSRFFMPSAGANEVRVGIGIGL